MDQKHESSQHGRSAAGAMTTAMRAVARTSMGPKVLRLGLVRDGKIIEERIVRRRESVSVGTSEKNQFIVQAQGLPSWFELFQVVGGAYVLNFRDDMEGRVGTAGGIKELGELRAEGARRVGEHHQVELDDDARGKVQIGDTTLLFQFVVPPPVTPLPQLPAAARGGFVKGIDWLFTTFVVFSYMTFFGFVVFLENADWGIEQGSAAVPELMARLLIDEPEPPPEPVRRDVSETETPSEDEDVESPSPEESVVARRDTNDARTHENRNDINTSADERARIAHQATRRAEQLLIAGLGPDGALANMLDDGAVTVDAAEILEQVNGVDFATESNELRERSGGDEGSGQNNRLGVVAANVNAGMRVATRRVEERGVSGRITLPPGGDTGGSGDFDARLVVQQIRRRLSAIQRCYENELRHDPSLAGKVTVEFTIVERGTVSGTRTVENSTGSSAVASCVARTVNSFRFTPGPVGGSVDFRYPFVFAPQN